jgi:hypothetical protein
MSAAHEIAVPTFNLAATSPPEGHTVVRRPEQLRMHGALVELGWPGVR